MNLKNLKQAYKKGKFVTKGIGSLITILAFGVLIILVIQNYDPNQSEQNPEQEFQCKSTSDNDLVVLNTSGLKTQKEISLVDFENDIYQSDLQKNDIPAIFDPKFEKHEELSPCIQDSTRIVIVRLGNDSRAYPVTILSQHIAVNDVINGIPILVTYSPLAGIVKVYDRIVNNKTTEFGISGLLYKNNDLLYDIVTESLWSQFDGRARVGTMSGASLKQIDYEIVMFGELKKNDPDILILSFDTGYRRDYTVDLFEGFDTSDEILQKIKNVNTKLKSKQIVMGFSYGDNVYAIPVNDLEEDNSIFKVDGIEYIAKLHSPKHILVPVYDEYPVINYYEAYWYVWSDFFPDTVVLSK